MILNVWILLVIIALVVLTYSLISPDDEIALVTSALAGILWIVISYGALNLETFSSQRDEYIAQSEPALSVLALIGVFLAIINVCVIVFDWLGDTTDDVNGE